MHDDVGVIGRAGSGEVVLLGGNVAAAVAPLDVGGGSVQQLVPDPGTIERLLERCGHKDAQIPPINQLQAQQERAVMSSTASAGAVVVGGDSAVSVLRS